MYHWAIEINNEIIGSISAISIDEKKNNCELGFYIGYDYWNKGITSKALSAVISQKYIDRKCSFEYYTLCFKKIHIPMSI